jgi:hypothetical protein
MPEAVAEAPKPAPTPSPKPAAKAPTGPPVEAPRAPKRSVEEYFEKPKKEPSPAPAPKPAPAPEPEAKSEPEPASDPAPDPAPEPAKAPDPLDLDLETLTGKKPEVQAPVEAGPKELRAAYEKLKNEHGSLAAKVKKLEALESVKEEFERVQKELDELSTKLEQDNYLDSPTYKNTWEEPFVEKLEGLYKEAESMLAEDGSRTGTQADVNELYGLWKDRTKALMRARELFGQDSTLIIQKLNDLKEFEAKRDKAIGTWKQTKAQRQQQAMQESQQQKQAFAETWLNSIESERKAHPELYTFDGDEELGKLGRSGESLADAAFIGVEGLEPVKMVQLQAIVRNRAAAFGPMARKALKLEARVKELEGQIKEYEAGAPEHKGSKGESSGGKKRGLGALDDYMKA